MFVSGGGGGGPVQRLHHRVLQTSVQDWLSPSQHSTHGCLRSCTDVLSEQIWVEFQRNREMSGWSASTEGGYVCHSLWLILSYYLLSLAGCMWADIPKLCEQNTWDIFVVKGLLKSTQDSSLKQPEDFLDSLNSNNILFCIDAPFAIQGLLSPNVYFSTPFAAAKVITMLCHLHTPRLSLHAEEKNTHRETGSIIAVRNISCKLLEVACRVIEF